MRSTGAQHPPNSRQCEWLRARGGVNCSTRSARHGTCAGESRWHVCAAPRAPAVLYLIDQLIISGIQLHIGFR